MSSRRRTEDRIATEGAAIVAKMNVTSVGMKAAVNAAAKVDDISADDMKKDLEAAANGEKVPEIPLSLSQKQPKK